MRWVLGRGVAGSSLLTLGGLCYVQVSRPSWVTHSRVLTAIRDSPAHLALGLTLSAAGLVLLTWAWWSLRRFSRDPADGVTSVRVAAACWSLPMLIAPPLFSGDGWSYVATGYLTGHGYSPYVWTPSILPPALSSGVNARWLNTPSPYGPLAVGWGGLLSRVTSDPWLLMVGYRVFALLGLALLAWATPRIARRCGQDPGEASWLVLASPFLIAQGVGGMHNDLPMVALGATALAVTTRDRWWWGAVLVGAAAAIKVPGGLVAVGVVLLSLGAAASLRERVRRTVAVAALASVTLVAIGLIADVGVGWISTISGPTSLPTPLSVTYRLGKELNSLASSGSPHPGHAVVRLVEAGGVLAVLALAVGLVLFRPTGADGRVLGSVAGLMVLVTVLSPVEHYWYFLWSLPLVACVALTPPLRAAALTLITVLGLTAIGEPSLRIGWLSTSATYAVTWLPLLVFVALLVRSRSAVVTEEVAA